MATCGKCHKAGQTISHIKACHGIPAAKTAPVEVPDSSYALVGPSGDLVYVQTEHGSGKWASFQFLNRLVGHPGSWAKYPIKGAARRQVLEMIAADPKAAAMKFSETFTCCAACQSPLSVKESRELGFGPVCIKKFAA